MTKKGNILNQEDIQLVLDLQKVRIANLTQDLNETKKKYKQLKEGEEWLKKVVENKDQELKDILGSKKYKYGQVLYRLSKLQLVSREKLIQKDNKDNKDNKHLDEIVRELKKVIDTDNKKIINVLTYEFFNSESGCVNLGGAERFLTDLAHLVSKNGKKMRIFQSGGSKLWIKNYENIEVIGLPVIEIESLQHIFYSIINDSSTTIYSPFTLAVKKTKSSIGISHGVYWDSEEYQKDNTFYNRVITDVINGLEACQRIVSVDTNTINVIRSTNKILAEKITYIPNYVDLDTFKASNKKHTGINIIFPRRICKPRGFNLLLDSMEDILKIGNDIKIIFVGQAIGKDLKIIKEISSKYPNRIIWETKYSDEMANVYHKADITLIPTISSEGTSLSCLEAMASGNAVIATNIGGLNDLIIDDYNGLLISPRKEELIEAIKKLYQNKKLRKMISKNAVLVSKVFSKDNWNREWLEVLEHV